MKIPMYGTTKTDPVKQLEKDLAVAQFSRAGHANRHSAAEGQLPKAEVKVKQHLDDPVALKDARAIRQEIRDEIADMADAIAADDAEIARISAEIKAIADDKRRREVADELLEIEKGVIAYRSKLDAVMVEGVSVKGAILKRAAAASQDFAGIVTAIEALVVQFPAAFDQAQPTLGWLANATLKRDRPALIGKPEIALVSPPSEPVRTVRVFTVHLVRYADPHNPTQVIRKARYQYADVLPRQAAVGLKAQWLLPEGDGRIPDLLRRKSTDQIPDFHLTNSLDEEVTSGSSESLLPDASDPVIASAQFTPMPRGPKQTFRVPVTPVEAPRVASRKNDEVDHD